jgi:hypothetical protein
MTFAGPDFVKVHEDANSKVDEIDPGQSFLRVNILRWREIFRVIETSSHNVDLIGLVGQRRSTVTAKCPPRTRLRNAIVRSNYAARRPGHPGPHRHKAPTAQAPRCSTQRAGIAPPHAEGDGLSGVTSDGETFAFISVPAGVAGGVPVTRARNPWAMPVAST